jgi:hypothetical protein
MWRAFARHLPPKSEDSFEFDIVKLLRHPEKWALLSCTG